MSRGYKGGWVEKQIGAETRTLVQVLYAISCVFVFAALILAYMALSPYIDGVSVLDSPEKLERFCGKDYEHATLVYETAFDTQGTFGLTDGSDEIEYRVWWLTGDGYTVIYCTDTAFKDTGAVQVQSQYLDTNAQIMEVFSPGGDSVYVVYDAGSAVPFMVMLISLVVAAAVAVFLAKSSFLRKKTKLGRQIAALGNYHEVLNEMNRQAGEPFYESADCTILKDWVFFRTYVYPLQNKRYWTEILPMGNIADIEIARDNDDGTMYACRFSAQNGAQPHVTYVNSRDIVKIEALKKELFGSR